MYKSQTVVDLEMHNPNPPVGDPSVETAARSSLGSTSVMSHPSWGVQTPVPSRARKCRQTHKCRCAAPALSCHPIGQDFQDLHPSSTPYSTQSCSPLLSTDIDFKWACCTPNLSHCLLLDTPQSVTQNPALSCPCPFNTCLLSFPLPHLVSWTVPSWSQ